MSRKEMAEIVERADDAIGKSALAARCHTGCGGTLEDYWTPRTIVYSASERSCVFVDRPELLTKCDRCHRIGIGVPDEPA